SYGKKMGIGIVLACSLVEIIVADCNYAVVGYTGQSTWSGAITKLGSMEAFQIQIWLDAISKMMMLIVIVDVARGSRLGACLRA
nr:hypothetical protein [Tanacetum cinerariifolium]